MQKMSVRKQRIAKKLEVLGITFDGQKTGGVYKIGMVTCRTLDEVGAHIESLEKANAQQSVAEAGVVEHKEKPAESWQDWGNAMKSSKVQVVSLKCFKDDEPVYVDVQGYVSKGLLLHKDVQCKHKYTVTHIDSSIPILARFKANKDKAQSVLEDLANVLDWTQDPFHQYSPEKRQRIAEIAESIY